MDMYGNLSDCFGETTTGECLSKCQFTEKVMGKFFTAGLYQSDSMLFGIIQAFIDTAFEIYDEHCKEPFSFARLLRSLTDADCPPELIANSCVSKCGSEYQTHKIDNCKKCSPISVSDDFLGKMVVFTRMRKSPTYKYYKEVSDLFGWEVIYTDVGILFVGNTNEIRSIIKKLPSPIGEVLLIATEGC